MSPSASPVFSSLAAAQTTARNGQNCRRGSNRNVERDTALSNENSPPVSLSASLSSSVGLSSSLLGGMVSHLVAPTPSNTPNFNAAYIQRAGCGNGVSDDALSERLREIDITNVPASRAGPTRNHIHKNIEPSASLRDRATEDLDIAALSKYDANEVPTLTFTP